jgi:hypothetical protein
LAGNQDPKCLAHSFPSFLSQAVDYFDFTSQESC